MGPRVGPHPAVLQDAEAAAPIHGIVRLAQIQEEAIERALFDVGKLLDELGLHNPGAAPPFLPESVEGVVEGDALQSSVQDHFQSLPRRLQQAYPAVVVS